METEARSAVEEQVKIEQQAKSGADWFFWIAGLSLINSLILLAGSQWSFIIGLGITQFIDAIALIIAEEIGIIGKAIGFFLDMIAAGIFVLFGVFARKRHTWKAKWARSTGRCHGARCSVESVPMWIRSLKPE